MGVLHVYFSSSSIAEVSPYIVLGTQESYTYFTVFFIVWTQTEARDIVHNRQWWKVTKYNFQVVVLYLSIFFSAILYFDSITFHNFSY